MGCLSLRFRWQHKWPSGENATERGLSVSACASIAKDTHANRTANISGKYRRRCKLLITAPPKVRLLCDASENIPIFARCEERASQKLGRRSWRGCFADRRHSVLSALGLANPGQLSLIARALGTMRVRLDLRLVRVGS